MSAMNDPAFPTPAIENRNGDVQYGAPGITKLEYFAGLAMQGSMALSWPDVPDAEASKRAKVAVANAKALIAELEKHQ